MKVVYIPEGIPNLTSVFPAVDFSLVEEWNVQIKDSSGNVIATTRTNIKSDCCDDRIRIHFVNSSGEIDSLNFSRPEESMETKSDSWEMPLRYPLDRKKGGLNRTNIRSNESIQAESNQYPESDQNWVKELCSTPAAWIEYLLPNGFSNPTTKEFLPIRISDAKIITRKANQRYSYVVVVKFEMANSNINIRG